MIQVIDCSEDAEFSEYSRCLIRDDINETLQIIFICYAGIFILLLIKNIYNLVGIYKAQKASICRYMKAMNIVIMFYLILSIIHYSDGLCQFLKQYNIYPLFLYQAIDTTAILVLNSALSLGAYFWISTIFKATFNYNKVSRVKNVCKILMYTNIASFILVIVDTSIYRIQDYTLASNSYISREIIKWILFVSSSSNGIFFSLGCFILWRSMRRKDLIHQSANTKVENLVICSAIFSLVRALQDLGNLYGWVMKLFFKSSIENDSMAYPIYFVLLILVASVAPAFLILIKFSPYIESDDKDLSRTNSSENSIRQSLNEDIEDYLDQMSINYKKMKQDGKKRGLSMII